jgi:hypothetical protein
MRTHLRRLRHGALAVVIIGLTLLFVLATGGTLSKSVFAQLLPDEELSSWWASNPTMLDVSGTLRKPETVSARILSGGTDRWVYGYEALVFLLVQDYVEYVNYNGRLRLKTTSKYERWKQARQSQGGSGSGTGTYSAQPIAAGIIGSWKWFNGSTVTFSHGGSCVGTDRTLVVPCTWQVIDATQRTIRISWSNGYTDELRLSADGTKLDGTNQNRTRVSAVKGY